MGSPTVSLRVFIVVLFFSLSCRRLDASSTCCALNSTRSRRGQNYKLSTGNTPSLKMMSSTLCITTSYVRTFCLSSFFISVHLSISPSFPPFFVMLSRFHVEGEPRGASVYYRVGQPAPGDSSSTQCQPQVSHYRGRCAHDCIQVCCKKKKEWYREVALESLS